MQMSGGFFFSVLFIVGIAWLLIEMNYRADEKHRKIDERNAVQRSMNVLLPECQKLTDPSQIEKVPYANAYVTRSPIPGEPFVTYTFPTAAGMKKVVEHCPTATILSSH
jgi:hypothetical protein